MPVQVLQDWTLNGSGSASPSGTVTIDPAATNRCIIYWQSWEFGSASASTICRIGSVDPTGTIYLAANESADNPGLQIDYWNETAVAAISAAGSSNISFQDQINFNKRIWALGVFGSVEQATFPVANSSVGVSVSANGTLGLATPGETGDYVIIAHSGTRTSSSITFSPQFAAGAGFTKRFQAASIFTGGLGDGPWASVSSEQWARFQMPNTIGAVIVLEEAAPAAGTASGSGSIDGLIATVDGVGIRAITGSGSADGLVATLAGTGERIITGSSSIDGYIATVAGTGERIITAAPTFDGILPTLAATGERTITGTGSASDLIPTVAATGERTITGTGSAPALVVTVDGTGTVGNVILGTGSVDGYIATVAGTGERIVTGVASIDSILATLSGVGERTITGSGSVDGFIATVAGAGTITAGSGSFEHIVRIARSVRFDDETYGFQVLLHQDPSVHAEQILDVTNAGVTFYSYDDWHGDATITDHVDGQDAHISDTITKLVTVQGLD